MALALLVAFGGGMVSVASPCVLPLVPVYLALITRAGTTPNGAGSGRSPVLRDTALFIAGFSAVFVLLGSTASVAGRLVASDHRLLSRLAGSVVIAMAVFLAATQLAAGRRWAAPLGREYRLRLRVGGGRWAPPVTGVAFALGWTPCIGPVLASVLTLASVQGQAGRGAALLLAYSLGLGVPFVAAAGTYSRWALGAGWLRRHGRAVTLGSAFLMAGFGLLVVLGRLSLVTTDLGTVAW